jgi:hypothetical protein
VSQAPVEQAPLAPPAVQPPDVDQAPVAAAPTVQPPDVDQATPAAPDQPVVTPPADQAGADQAFAAASGDQ